MKGHLLDRVVGHIQLGSRENPFMHNVADLAGVERFIFDKAASFRAGQIAKEIEREVVLQRSFARLPYPLTYVEFHIDEFFKGFGRPTTLERNPKESLGDTRVAYLLSEEAILSLFEVDISGSAVINPIIYVRGPASLSVGKGFPIQFYPLEDGITEEELCGQFYLGSTGKYFDDAFHREVGKEYHPVSVVRDQELAKQMVSESVGDLRNVWLLLHLINQPTSEMVVGLEPVPRRAGLIGNRRSLIPAHRAVRINLDEKRPIPSSIILGNAPSDRASPYLHKVRGHFVHFGVDPACHHIWKPIDARRWTCESCGGRRTWKFDMERGDPNRPRPNDLHKDYEFTARKGDT